MVAGRLKQAALALFPNFSSKMLRLLSREAKENRGLFEDFCPPQLLSAHNAYRATSRLRFLINTSWFCRVRVTK